MPKKLKIIVLHGRLNRAHWARRVSQGGRVRFLSMRTKRLQKLSRYNINGAGVPFNCAFEAVVLANRIYWHGETGFYDGACGVLRAANELGQDVRK
ncbi:hypothetical protein RRG08_041788 [Elysia crispata]|uniref:Uncharacterized protein n=1 Tax=Elysia crispata TaxID=231223 RepID=A0AAE1ECY5_9GAST|nr:hypothetical protein RRG08_041788 [Elysia crispata]